MEENNDLDEDDVRDIKKWVKWLNTKEQQLEGMGLLVKFVLWIIGGGVVFALTVGKLVALAKAGFKP